jgi:hypothetical protein
MPRLWLACASGGPHHASSLLMKHLYLLILAAALFTGGCATQSSHVLPHADLAHYKTAFVVHLLTDGHQTDEKIAQDLRDRGLSVTAGPMTMLPDHTDLLVEYQDNWAWDFKNYMIGIGIQIKEIKSDKVLATGSINKPAMVMGESSTQLIHNLLNTLFK